MILRQVLEIQTLGLGLGLGLQVELGLRFRRNQSAISPQSISNFAAITPHSVRRNPRSVRRNPHSHEINPTTLLSSSSGVHLCYS